MPRLVSSVSSLVPRPSPEGPPVVAVMEAGSAVAAAAEAPAAEALASTATTTGRWSSQAGNGGDTRQIWSRVLPWIWPRKTARKHCKFKCDKDTI